MASSPEEPHRASDSDKAIAGGACGLLECLAVQPFDLLKTRFQLMSNANPSIMSAFRDIYREGGVTRFYRGIAPEMAGMVPKNTAMYFWYDTTREYLEPQMGGPCASVEFLSALACSFPEALTVTPFQVVKVRLQSKEHLARYNGTFHALTTILREEGPLALSRGLTVTTFRNAVWNSVYFPTMFLIKKHLMPPTEKGTLLGTCSTMVSGFCGGAFATCFNAPFDVAKSRIQAQIEGQPKVYTSVFPSLLLIVRDEGPAALYKGFKPKLLRMGIGGAVAMASYELIIEVLNARR